MYGFDKERMTFRAILYHLMNRVMAYHRIDNNKMPSLTDKETVYADGIIWHIESNVSTFYPLVINHSSKIYTICFSIDYLLQNVVNKCQTVWCR